MRRHTHKCGACLTGVVDCVGSRVDNYDGFPRVLCSVEADMRPGDVFICEDCDHARDIEEEEEGGDDE